MLLRFIFLLIGVYGQKIKFDNYQLFRLLPKNEAQVTALRELELAGEFDFWTRVGAINRSVDVLVPPYKNTTFQHFIGENGIASNCQIKDIQRFVQELNYLKPNKELGNSISFTISRVISSVIDEQENQVKSRCIDMDWNNYHKLDEIYDWMDDIAKKYSFVRKFYAGKSYQGRKIKGVEISFQKNTTGVFMESGMHGREWITPAATSWMIKRILDSPGDSVFRNFTYFYIPVVNPDGYAYSWSHDRLWKKTRKPYKNGTKICYGADPNRNWDIKWKEFRGSDNPCSENYPGPNSFSETETKSTSDYLKCIARSRNVDIYIAYRSYSQLLHYPRDHERTPAPQQDLWQRIGEASVIDLREVHGTQYEVGSFSHFFEPVGGSSRDWYYEMYNSTITYTYELSDTGGYGFLLPPEQIIPTGEELLPSLERILKEYLRLNVTQPNLTP